MRPTLMTLSSRLIRNSVPRPPTRLVKPAYRNIHSTPPRLASEVNDNPFEDPSIKSFYDKIRNHQPAVDAMLEIGKIMQSKGIDTTKPPSKMEMMKLAFDSDLRTATQKLMAEMQNAGVELSPETMKALFDRMNK